MKKKCKHDMGWIVSSPPVICILPNGVLEVDREKVTLCVKLRFLCANFAECKTYRNVRFIMKVADMGIARRYKLQKPEKFDVKEKL